MIEIVGDIWKQRCNWLCVTTNGMVNKDGKNIMGKGIALQARNRFPGIDSASGKHIQEKGNVPTMLHFDDEYARWIVSFPTKYDWRDKSDIKLIEESAIQIKLHAMKHYNSLGEHPIVAMTRPGCGCGGLDWEKEVKPILDIILTNDRFLVFTKD